MVEHQLEHRCERRLQVGGVGQPVLEGLVGDEIVERGDHLVERLFELRMSLDEATGMCPVSHRMLPLLPDEGVGLFGDHRVGQQWLGFGHGADDHLLERNCQEGHGICHRGERGVGLVPEERHWVVRESEPHLADLEVGHWAPRSVIIQTMSSVYGYSVGEHPSMPGAVPAVYRPANGTQTSRLGWGAARR